MPGVYQSSHIIHFSTLKLVRIKHLPIWWVWNYLIFFICISLINVIETPFKCFFFWLFGYILFCENLQVFNPYPINFYFCFLFIGVVYIFEIKNLVTQLKYLLLSGLCFFFLLFQSWNSCQESSRTWDFYPVCKLWYFLGVWKRHQTPIQTWECLLLMAIALVRVTALGCWSLSPVCTGRCEEDRMP